VTDKTCQYSQDRTGRAKIVSVRELSYDEIAREAFVRWINRGREHGRDVQDWLAAEAAVRVAKATAAGAAAASADAAKAATYAAARAQCADIVRRHVPQMPRIR